MIAVEQWQSGCCRIGHNRRASGRAHADDLVSIDFADGTGFWLAPHPVLGRAALTGGAISTSSAMVVRYIRRMDAGRISDGSAAPFRSSFTRSSPRSSGRSRCFTSGRPERKPTATWKRKRSQRLEILQQRSPVRVRPDARPEVVTHVATSRPAREKPVPIGLKAAEPVGLRQASDRRINGNRLADLYAIECARRRHLKDEGPL
jgi:hypothetical protein